MVVDVRSKLWRCIEVYFIKNFLKKCLVFNVHFYYIICIFTDGLDRKIILGFFKSRMSFRMSLLLTSFLHLCAFHSNILFLLLILLFVMYLLNLKKLNIVIHKFVRDHIFNFVCVLEISGFSPFLPFTWLWYLFLVLISYKVILKIFVYTFLYVEIHEKGLRRLLH